VPVYPGDRRRLAAVALRALTLAQFSQEREEYPEEQLQVPIVPQTGDPGPGVESVVTVLPSVCPLDCPDACSLEVRVEEGRVIEVDGSHVNALTDGFICANVRRPPRWLYSAERILHPAIRDPRAPKGEGRFERAPWDEALGLIAQKLLEVRETFGGEAILPYSYGG
jgi:anaerobic selenocysteine-containing dehydrogenase